MTGILRYWHTVRHLKPTQFVARVRFHLWWPLVGVRAVPTLRAGDRRAWATPAPHHASMTGPEEFRFLNRRGTLATHGWADPALEKLWRYHLHYFSDLVAPSGEARTVELAALVARWVRENAPGQGAGWEPYPTSLRIVNWIKWALAGNSLTSECVTSLAIQTRWLRRRLEYHLLGNHLFANAKALVFAGLFFDGPEAADWLVRGLAILERQLPEQILIDGGHFEQSPMYHALMLEDLMDLVNVTNAYSEGITESRRPMQEDWRERIQQMRLWLSAMCHPDGEIAFFNDAAIGVAPTTSALNDYAQRLGFGAVPSMDSAVHRLDSTGYVRLEKGPSVALLDVGRVGPDYLPAHAHADTLSFELSLFGQRVLVNSGTSCYGSGPERLRQRGTSAHNTVVVDGENSSEVWSGFRVARRARPAGLSIGRGDEITVQCAHDGYHRLPGRPTHTRRWVLCRDSLLIEDRIDGRFRHSEARFHLHPAVSLAAAGDGARALTLTLPTGQRIDATIERGRMRVERASWHPEFGVSLPTQCIAVQLESALSHVRFAWRDGS
jgi:uncharacterized heparinase superfamily protein